MNRLLDSMKILAASLTNPKVVKKPKIKDIENLLEMLNENYSSEPKLPRNERILFEVLLVFKSKFLFKIETFDLQFFKFLNQLDLKNTSIGIVQIFLLDSIKTASKKSTLLTLQVSSFRFIIKVINFMNAKEFLGVIPKVFSFSIQALQGEIRNKSDYLVMANQLFATFITKYFKVNKEDLANFAEILKK